MGRLTGASSKRDTAQKKAERPPPISLPFYQKLFLTAAFLGNDMCVSFQQLYEVTLLQLQGVPVPFVSLYPVVAGPVAMVLVAVNGYISDKGANHRYRKIAVLIFNTLFTLCGISMLLVANFMLLSISGKMANTSADAHEITTAGIGNSSYHFSTQFSTTNTPLSESTSQQGELKILPRITRDFPDVTKPPLSPESDPEDQGQHNDTVGLLDLPTTAVLGILGFAFMDIGYDTNIAATRACVLACSPTADHTSLLVLALVMGASGGLVNCALGLTDLTHVLDLGSEVGSLVPQTIIQLLLSSAVLVLFLLCTVITALVNITNLYANTHVPFSTDDDCGENSNVKFNDSVAFEKMYGTFDVNEVEHDTTFVEKSGFCPHDSDAHERTVRMNSASEATPKTAGFAASKGLRTTHDVHHDVSVGACSSNSTSVTLSHNLEAALYLSNDFSNLYLSQELSGSIRRSPVRPLRHAEEEPLVGAKARRWCGLDPQKIDLGLSCVVVYLGSSALYSYNSYTAQFVGNVVMDGDLNAPAGSEELKAYETGVSYAAGGLLIFNCAYVVASVLQSKLLTKMGLRLDYCVFHILMATGIVLLLLTEEVAAFFVTNTCYGFQRSALYTVPFIVAKNYIHEKGLEEKGGSVLGRVVALVTCMVPLNFCTIFVISGPLVSLTSYDGASIALASAALYLAACIFALYGRF